MRSHRHAVARAGLVLWSVVVGLGTLVGCSVDPHIERLAGRWQGKNSKTVFEFDTQGKGTLYLYGGSAGEIDGPCEKGSCVDGECVTLPTVTFDSEEFVVKQCQARCTNSGSCGNDHSCAELMPGYYCVPDQGWFPPFSIEAGVDSFNEYRVNFGSDSEVGKPGSPILVGCRLEGDALTCAEEGLFGDSFITDTEFVREVAADGG